MKPAASLVGFGRETASGAMVFGTVDVSCWGRQRAGISSGARFINYLWLVICELLLTVAGMVPKTRLGGRESFGKSPWRARNHQQKDSRPL